MTALDDAAPPYDPDADEPTPDEREAAAVEMFWLLAATKSDRVGYWAAVHAADEISDHVLAALIARQYTSTDGQTPTPTEAYALLGLATAAEWVAEVDAAPPPTYLFAGVWPADAYGVLYAPWKAGKSWAVLDAACAVATGQPWLARYDVQRHGPVVMFLGEGGKRKMVRRGRAVAEAMGYRFEDLDIHLSERVPRLTDAAALASVRSVLAVIRPVLVIVDPLYLAAGSVDSRSLYAMGDVLVGIQEACQEAGAALMLAHHTNRDRTRVGSERSSGAGPAEWGRVLVGLTVTRDESRVGRSDVDLQLDWSGDEIAGASHHINRVVTDPDPDNLASPLTYEVRAIDPPPPDPDSVHLAPSARRVLAALAGSPDEEMGTLRIGDIVAADGVARPLAKRTIEEALKTLVEHGLAVQVSDQTHTDRGRFAASTWRVADGR